MSEQKPFSYSGTPVDRFDRAYLWHYRGSLERVIDGDTFVSHIDNGFNSCQKVRVRIEDLWTPEMLENAERLGLPRTIAEPGAVEAKEALEKALGRADPGERSLRIVTAQRKRSSNEEWSMERYVCDCYIVINHILRDVREVLLWTD